MTRLFRVYLKLGLMLALIGPSMDVFAQTVRLPISSFLDAQTFDDFMPATDPITGSFLGFDVFGRRAALFSLDVGTSFSGSVVIRDLHDGTEQVTVNLHTSNGICWGFTPAGPAFGHEPGEVLLGARASLGDAHTVLVFTQPSGNPLPSFFTIFAGAPIVALTLDTGIMCQNGELRAGSGYPEGTSGFAQTRQTGIAHVGVPSGCPPERDGDCFPAEKIQFKANGH